MSDPVDALIVDEAGPDSGATLALDGPALPAARHRSDRADQLGAGLLSPDDLAGIDTVLLRLPASLSALDDHAERIARWAAPGVRLVAGGRVKHLTHSMNDVLARHFTEVRASRGRQKSRVLHAAGPRPTALRWPQRRYAAALGLTVVARGATFNTTGLDRGTRLLARQLDQLDAGAGRAAIDLGCGSGILATLLARAGFGVTATDISAMACASTAATAAANEVEVAVRHVSGLTGIDEAGTELIVCNPPFHVGAAKDSTPAFAMITEAGRVLRPGGEFWCVYNAHLPYLPALRRDIGATKIIARDRNYLVTRSVAR